MKLSVNSFVISPKFCVFTLVIINLWQCHDAAYSKLDIPKWSLFINIDINYWLQQINNYLIGTDVMLLFSSLLQIVIHKQEVTILLVPVWLKVVPLLANKKSHYYRFKMNID